jgi:hypothetical protein
VIWKDNITFISLSLEWKPELTPHLNPLPQGERG